jgi:hypothetical protein
VYSGGPNRTAKFARGGASRDIPIIATVPPIKEPIAAIPRAAPALPCRAISYPSKVVTTVEASPGSRSKTEVIVPPYMEP